MKKILALILALTMALALAACGGKEPTETPENSSESGNNQSQPEQSENSAPEGAVTDETKLGESVTYYVDGENLYLKIKTSYEFDAHQAYIDIVNPGFYLTRNSQFITQCIFASGRDFDENFDKEWFDGIYVFKLDNSMISGLAADDSEWVSKTWTMMLYEGESGLVIGQWLIVLEGGGKYHFEFKDSWLRGAGEERKTEEFDSPEKEVESWFSYKADESYDEWAVFNFDGYYLEETDPSGYDKYYLFICPEGDYTTYEEADAVDLSYAGIGGFEYSKCPYRFAFEQYGIEPGKYTMVLAKMGGDVEIQFAAEKKSPTDWRMDFSNVKCPRLDSKHDGYPEHVPTDPEEGGESSDSAVLKLCGLTLNDILTSAGKSLGEITEAADAFAAPVYCEDTSFASFEAWLGALAENCRNASTDGKLYEDEFTWTEINSFELDPNAINVILFIYKTSGHSIYVTASNDGAVEGAFSCRIQVY